MVTMATANTPLELNQEQASSARGLSVVLQLAAGLLVLVGAVRLGLGVYTLLFLANVGLLFIVEGAPMVLLGLVLLAASKSTRYMADTKYTSIHLGHVFRDLTVYYQTVAGLAGFFLFLLLVWAIFG